MRGYFPNELKGLRIMAGYTQKEVAIFLNLSHTENILRWEKGIVLPGLIYLFQLSQLYKVPIHELYIDVWELLKDDIDLKIQQYERSEFISQLKSLE